MEKAFPGCPLAGAERVQEGPLEEAWLEARVAWAKAAAVGGGQWAELRDGSMWVQGGAGNLPCTCVSRVCTHWT